MNDKVEVTAEAVKAFRRENPEPEEKQLHVGHDLCNSLEHTVRQYRGGGMKKKSAADFLRENYPKEEFLETALYRHLTSYLNTHYDRN